MNNYSTTLIPVCLLSFFLIGCSSVGTNFDSRKIADIKKGETNEKDLITMFGRPATRGINSEQGSSLTWLYTESSIKGETFIPLIGSFAGGVNTKNKTLVVQLDQAGVVSSYSYSGGDLSTSNTSQTDPETSPAVPNHPPKGK